MSDSIRRGFGSSRTILRVMASLALLAAALPVSAALYGSGSYVDGAAGPNGVHDVSLATCDPVLGCFTNTGARCGASPDERCDVQVTPAGRCSYGNTSCVWPQGAGACRHDGGAEPVDPVPCLSDAYLSFLENGGPSPGNLTGPSVMCADVIGSDGFCDMSSNDPSCDCSGTDPQADPTNDDPDVPSWEGVVCGDSPRSICSDGDPLRLETGHGVATCYDFCINPPCSTSPSCENHTQAEELGVKYPSENPRDRFTPQRRAGTGLAAPDDGGPARGAVRTAPWTVDDVGQGDFVAERIRRLRRFSNGAFWDEVYHAALPEDLGVEYSTTTYACAVPQSAGWSTDLPISGRCKGASGAFCLEDSDCPPACDFNTTTCVDDPGTICFGDEDCPNSGCDPSSFEYCHEADDDPHTQDARGFDGTGFLYTRALTAGQQTGQCPGDCRVGYDLDTFEIEALDGASTSEDPRAGAQLFFDELEGPRAGQGDVLAALRFVVSLALVSGDPRCYLGGDPHRPDPSDDRIGRCRSSAQACDPRLPTTSNGCPGEAECLFCGGTSSDAPHPSNDYYYPQFSPPRGFDSVRGNPSALPIGFNTHGLAALSPVGRVGRLNGVPSSFEIPLFVLLAPGPARATFKDDQCGFPDSCNLGGVIGGSAGLGATDTFIEAGDPVPHEPNAAAPPYLVSLTIPPHDPGTHTSGHPTLLVPEDFGVGPDGIPGCFGDNSDPPTCDERLGDPADAGSTGSDDRAILYDFSATGDGSALRTAAGPRGDLPSAHLAVTPPWTSSAATALRNVDLFGSPTDLIQKMEWTFCPIQSRGSGFPEFDFACQASDLDGDGWLDEQDGCPLNPALHPSIGAGGEITPLPDSGGVATPANLQANLPDGIADACQCGDATDDGIVNGNDATLITFACINFNGFFPAGCSTSQAKPRFAWEKCDVGAQSPGNRVCNGNDATLILFTTLGLVPGLDNVCPAYLP